MNAFKRIAAVSALIISSAAALSAANYTTNGTSGNWTDTAVWTGGTVPPAPGTWTDNTYVFSGSTVTVNSTITNRQRLIIGYLTSSGTLVISTGGNLAVTNRVVVGDRDSGTLILSGDGTLQVKGTTSNYLFYVGNTNAASETARGQLTVSDNGRLLFNNTTSALTGNVGVVQNDVSGASAIATISQTGGTIAGTINLNVSNTTLSDTSQSMSSQISLLGGTFGITGTAAFGSNANTTGNAHVTLTVSSNMTSATISGATNFSGMDTSLIFALAQRSSWEGKKVIEFGGALTIDGAAGVIVDLSDFGVWDGATVGDSVTVTLATYASLTKTSTTADTITGLDTSLFSASDITWGANAATITLTYVPEPAVAMGVLGVFALVFAVRRRRV